MKNVILIILAMLLSTLSAASADDIGHKRDELKSVNEQIQITRDDLEELKEKQRHTVSELRVIDRKQIKTFAEIDILNAEIRYLLSEIDSIDEQIGFKATDLRNAEFELGNISSEITESHANLKNVIAESYDYEKLFAKRLRTMYINRNASYLGLLIHSENYLEFFRRLEIIKRIITFDNKVLLSLKTIRRNIENKKMILEERRQKFTHLVETIKLQKSIISEKKQERVVLISKLENKQEAHKTLLSRLESHEQNRNSTLMKLKDDELSYESKLDELEETSKLLESKIQELVRISKTNENVSFFSAGQIQWPVPGFYRVTSHFGYRIHPVFGTKRMHTGIDIGSNLTESGRQSVYGQNFVAAADGVVIFAGWFGGYGNCVIIDHGGGITTLYGHGSRILVREGQIVQRGNPVMTVGSTGVSTGAHAHFEVRVNGIPVNPMQYFEQRQ